ncbi:MAG: DUF5711 family protein [Lachnospiraceae bacterium]|nr:DUF5711 family protein [Lachnospiraceae bacterium]
MKDRSSSQEREKLNNQTFEENSETFDDLEEALGNQVELLTFSEFDDEEETWSLFKRKKDSHGSTILDETDPRESEKFSDEFLKEFKKKKESEEPGAESAESDGSEKALDEKQGLQSGDDAADLDDAASQYKDDDDDPDLDDADYIQSPAYRKRNRRTFSYQQREKRRIKRIEAFWDFVERSRKQIRWLSLGLVVIIGAAAAGIVARNWTYHSLNELVVSEKEDTLSVSYARIGDTILKYGVDSAVLVDQNNSMIWTVSYNMSAPKVDRCGETFVIYDSKGTGMVICNGSGRLGEISADKPIVKANVSEQGVVAAILEDGENSWINLYSKEGAVIATMKTTFTNPGYPMDLDVSHNGTLLAVNYLYMDNGTPVSRVSFYNFGTVGQNQQDNLVAEMEYRDNILPEIEYVDSETCVSFREEGFSIYSGRQIPAETVTIETDSSIVSTFYDEENIGLVLQNVNSENDYTICLYDLKGREVLRKETDFRYNSIELNGGQIVLSSKDEFCVYSLQGVEKYRGVLEIPARMFMGFGRNKFIYVTEELFRIVQIR